MPKTLTDSGSKPSYSFKVRYPQFNSAVAFPGLQAFNQYAEQAARDLLASYQKNLKDTIGTPDPNFGSSFMEANYQVNSGTHGMLSIQYTVSDYWSGAAHPNSYTMVINFDLVRGKKFELQEIFLPGVNYLQALSDICSTDLKKRDRLEFPEGVLPKVENFQNWNFNDQGLLIFFDPYQVAAYALGPSQVVVPYSALKGMLNPAGPLGVFIK